MISANKKIIVVIPALNEIKTIKRVVTEAKQYVDEIIVVDDGSSDGTGLVAINAGAFVISHEKNQGYEKSIEDGFREAVKKSAFVILTFDADGQHQAKDIKRLSDPIINNEVDMVIGDRQGRKHICEKIFAFYTRFGFGIKDPLCGLKAYNHKIYETIGRFDTLGSIGTQLMIEAVRQGFRFKNIPIKVDKRQDSSRFYSDLLGANHKIFMAMIRVILSARQTEK